MLSVIFQRKHRILQIQNAHHMSHTTIADNGTTVNDRITAAATATVIVIKITTIVTTTSIITVTICTSTFATLIMTTTATAATATAVAVFVRVDCLGARFIYKQTQPANRRLQRANN